MSFHDDLAAFRYVDAPLRLVQVLALGVIDRGVSVVAIGDDAADASVSLSSPSPLVSHLPMQRDFVLESAKVIITSEVSHSMICLNSFQ